MYKYPEDKRSFEMDENSRNHGYWNKRERDKLSMDTHESYE